MLEISARVTPGKHGVRLIARAGGHLSKQLVVPSDVTIVKLPTKCSKLNPVENSW